MLSGQVAADRALPGAQRQLDEVLRLLVNRLAERQTAQFCSLPSVEFEEKVPVVSIDGFSYPLTPPLQILIFSLPCNAHSSDRCCDRHGIEDVGHRVGKRMPAGRKRERSYR